MRLAIRLKAAALVLVFAVPAAAQTLGPPIPKGPHVITGRLLDVRDNTPVGGAIVTITGYLGESRAPRRDTPLAGSEPAFAPRNVMTSADGRFVFRDMPAGRYAIAASAFGYLANTFPQHWVDVTGDDDPTHTTLRIWKSSSISGAVTDDRGEPVVGVLVAALRRETAEGREGLTRITSATTDDRGEYRLANLAPGSYLVGALASSVAFPEAFVAGMDELAGNSSAQFQYRAVLLRSGLRPELGAALRIGGHALLRTGPVPAIAPDGRLLAYASMFYPGTSAVPEATALTLASGDTRVGINLTLRFVPAVTVSGTVAGPDGPLADTFVRLQPVGGYEGDALDTTGVDGAVSDAQGRFTMLAIPPGDYELVVSTRVGEEGASFLITGTQRVTVPAEGISGLHLAAQAGPDISGRVVFATHGPDAPRPSPLRIGLRPAGAGSWRSEPGWAQADGTFTARAEGPGPFEVYAMHGGSAWAIDRVTHNGRVLPDNILTVADRPISGVEVTFTTAKSTLTGIVTSDRAQPDAAHIVIMFPVDGTAWRKGLFNDRTARYVTVSSAGAYTAVLPAGEYYVAAVPVHSAYEWRTPEFLQRLSTVATTVTLRHGDTRTLALTPVSPGGR